jgi:Rad3-related DNA helicase
MTDLNFDGLVPIGQVNAMTVFSNPEQLDGILKKIEAMATALVPDTSSVKGRKEIASTAYKVSQSKTAIDAARKALVTEQKKSLSMIDAQGRRAREFLDSLRDKVRQPLTEWEFAETERIAAEKLKKEIEEAHRMAIEENQLFDERRDIERRKAELERLEAERREKEERERIEREKAEAEKKAEHERIKREREIAEKAAKTFEKKDELENIKVFIRSKFGVYDIDKVKELLQNLIVVHICTLTAYIRA